MFKMVLVLKFRPDMDPEEVRNWWRNPHGALGLEVPGLVRYVQNHWVAPVGDVYEERPLPYDGSVDCWFESQEACEKAMASPEWAALVEDGPAGFDMSSLQACEVIEHVMRWDGQPDAATAST